ncbi:TolC family protein [uncultured Duncaniella sp.]|uniref:TolC family protein n=2 Tax=uncultured Duncaniella sp. TaxID=2768039 RepID=UPI003522B44A
MRRAISMLLVLLGVAIPPLRAQSVRAITLDEAIILARTGSVDAAVALNQLKTAYWEYRTFRADLLPEVNLDATLPSYRKSYNAYQQSDGSYTFVRNNYLQLNGELSVSQNIWLTGGKLSLNTSLDFMRQLSSPRSSRYMSIPIALTLSQPVFGTNHVRWNRRIAPVRYAEARARFISETEQVAMTAITHYFNLLMAREQVKIAEQNLANSEKLYEVAIAKRGMGKISENDLLQLELNVLDARSDLTSKSSDMKNCMFRLRSFLGLSDDVEIEPVVPGDIPGGKVIYADILDRALVNNAFSRNIRRRQLEADYEVAKARGNMREITLYAQIGFTGTSDALQGAYNPLKDNQVVQLGLKVPLLDWGKRRGKVKLAQSNRDVVESRLRQERLDFSQDIFVLVERFNNQREQVAIAAKADEIAARRYFTNVETFMIGKLSTLDLNDSQIKTDEARRHYINQLFQYWYYYYQLRSITLTDPGTGRLITVDMDKL